MVHEPHASHGNQILDGHRMNEGGGSRMCFDRSRDIVVPPLVDVPEAGDSSTRAISSYSHHVPLPAPLRLARSAQELGCACQRRPR